MDRRSWPWKKKSDKIAAAPESSSDSSPAYSSRQSDDQAHDLSKAMEEDYDSMSPEERVRRLNERLAAALSEITKKENVAKQHAKVAEEAVSGWEKAEEEASALKKQLDLTVQQKLGLEDRVTHLDGALKECMRQLRYVREEQEQKIHEAVVNRTREWDKVRSEFEAKLEEMGTKLMDSQAQNVVFSKSLQERAKSLAHISEEKNEREAESQVFQVKLENATRENAKLRYELQVLTKEVEIKNDEREYSKRSAEAANKQQLEHVKKIAWLEGECQRLRALVRRKLPGPAAVAQMKLEVEAKEGGGETKRKRSLSRGASSPRAVSLYSVDEASLADSKDSELLSERLLAIEEENKMLKETLAKRNNELHAARLMCAKTASKLSKVEEQLEAVPKSRVVGTTALSTSGLDPHAASISGDSYNGDDHGCADAWASALIAELSQLKKDKTVNAAKLQEDLMDDFAEMERLASTMDTTTSDQGDRKLDGASDKSTGASESGISIHDERLSLEQALGQKQKELEAVNQMCNELTKKLANAEEQLQALQSKGETLSVNCCEGSDHFVASNCVRTSGRLHVEIPNINYDSESGSEVSTPSGNESKARLTSAMNRIIHVVELLAQESGAELLGFSSEARNRGHPVTQNVQWQNPELNVGLSRLASVSNDLLKGKIDLFEFISELSSALDFAIGLVGKSVKSKRQNNKLRESLTIEQLAELRAETSKLEHELAIANGKAESFEAQLLETENLLSGIRAQLSSSEHSRQLAENELAYYTSAKAELESEISAADADLLELQEKLKSLEIELQQEHARYEEVLSKLLLLEQKKAEWEKTKEHEDVARPTKEEEIAAAAKKLAECQNSIMALGKQLQYLGVSENARPNPLDMSPLPHGKSRNSFLHDEDVQSDDLGFLTRIHSQTSNSDFSHSRAISEQIQTQELYWSSDICSDPELVNTVNHGENANHYNGSHFAQQMLQDENERSLLSSPRTKLKKRIEHSQKHSHSGFSRFFSLKKVLAD